MKKTSRITALVLCMLLILGMMPISAFAATEDEAKTSEPFSTAQMKVATEKNSTLAPGITQDSYTLYNNKDEQVKMFITSADMSVDTVKLFTSYKDMDPTNYGMSKLTEQVAAFNTKAEAGDEYYQGTVVAGINASYYNMTTGKPTGAFVMNGVDVTTESEGNAYGYFAVMKDGSVKIGNKGDYSKDKGNIQEAIGIYRMLIVDGEICSGLDTTQYYPRQTIGITADGKVILMTADGNQAPKSVGTTIQEQAQIMFDLGCVWAGHLDGGGSCTYAAKAEGSNEFKIANSPSDGSERSVSNGFIMVSTAVSDGNFNSINLTAENNYVTPGTSVNITAKGVDSAGGAAEIPADVSWQLADSSFGTVADGVFTSNGTTGDAVVQMVYNGNVVGETTIHVVVPDSIKFSNDTFTVPYGKTAKLELTATYGLNEVTSKEEDFVLNLGDTTLGTLSGLSFTASEDTSVTTGTVTAALAINSDITDSAEIVLGKGSDVIVDFEDGTDNGFKLTYSDYNYYLPNSNVYVATAENGKVHSGDYSLALNIDYSNSLESGYQMIALYQDKQDYNGVGAQRLGMWMYIPDEYVGLWGRWMAYPITGVSESGEITYASSTITGQDYDGVEGKTGVVYSFKESGWHYVSIDTSAYGGAALRSGYYCFQFYISDRDGANFDYYFKNQHNVNGDFTVYIDDITFDYSSVVDDREAPVFGNMTYATPAMSDAVTLNDGATINGDTINFAAFVAENTQKSNYTGIDASTAKAYVDGNEVSATYSNGKISIDKSYNFKKGKHTVKLSICDKQGNYSSIIRTFDMLANNVPPVKVITHESDPDRISLGSIQYIDVVASDIESVQSVTVTLDLDNMSDWQLEHMVPSSGFDATYSLQKDENIAKITITRTGDKIDIENYVLVSIPVRAWFLDNGNKRNPTSTKEWTLAQFFASKEFWPVAVDIKVDQGMVTYTDGTTDTFTGDGVFIWTEMWANYGNMTSTAEGKEYYNSWNGGHTHTAEAIADKAATCTEDGYTGRTFCEVCNSVVDWGTTVPATGHTYETIDGVLKCKVCGELFNGEYTDGKTYVDGVVIADGWVGESYYRNGVKLIGLQEIDGLYYDFGKDGVCPNKARIDGFFFDEVVNAYRYFTSGKMEIGEVSIYPEVYFFDADGVAISGNVDVLGYTCTFDEKGAFVSSDDASVVDAGYVGTNIQYVLLDSGLLKVDGEGEMGDYSSSGKYPAWVTKNDTKSITSLEIGNGITKIGKFGFFRNGYIRTVKFEENSSLKTIGWGAFGHNWRLTGVTIPASVETLNSYAFYECGAMKYVAFEENSQLKTIEYGAFLNGLSLETVYIPDTVTSIGADVFYKVNPDVVLQVAENSVGHQYALNKGLNVELREGVVTVVESGRLNDSVNWTMYSNGVLEITGTGAMPNFASHNEQPWYTANNLIKKIVIGKDITSVGNYAFCYAQNLTEIVFEEGSKLTNVGVLSFFNTPKVKAVVLPDTVSYISSYAFGDCFALESVYVPQSTGFIYKTAFTNSGNVVLNVAKGTYAEEFAQANNVSYESREFVYIPVASGNLNDSVQWARYENGELWITGTGAMPNFASHNEQPWYTTNNLIKKIVIGKDITSVGNYAFCYAQNVTEIVFEEGSKLTNVGVLSFFNTPKVKNVVLPDTVSYISSYAFGDCFALESVYVPQSTGFIYKTAFTNSGNVVLNVAKGTYAEEFAQANNVSYESREFVYIPVASGNLNDSVQWARYENGELWITGTGAMPNFASHKEQPWYTTNNLIKKIVIGKDITSVGNYAFCYAQNVTEIVFEEGSKLTNVGVLSFFNTPKVKNVVLPDTVKSINAYAFGDCFALESVYIPQGVNFIHQTAFSNYKNLVLNVAKDTYSEQFAINNNILYAIY